MIIYTNKTDKYIYILVLVLIISYNIIIYTHELVKLILKKLYHFSYNANADIGRGTSIFKHNFLDFFILSLPL